MSELPPEIDTSRPHSARMYDYFIGGKNHFAADRETAREVLAEQPARADRGAREPRVPRPGGQVPGGGGGDQAVPRHRHRAADHEQRARDRAGRRRRRPASSTSTTTRSCSPTRGPCSPPRPRAAPPTSRPTCAIPRRSSPSPVTRDVLDFGQPIALMLVAILHFVAGRVPAGGDRRDPARRAAAGQLPRRDAPDDGSRPRSRRPRGAGDARRRASRCRSGTPTNSPSSRSPGLNWCRPAWCSSRNGGRTAPGRARRRTR